MNASDHLLLFGASTRAAAFSALRAGLRPWCVDLYADRDLQARCAVRKAGEKYPTSFVAALATAPPGPWMYTGGPENRPSLVHEMSQMRPLWGNGADVLERARDPWFVSDAIRAAGLPAPLLCEAGALPEGKQGTAARQWVRKPLKGSGGRDVSIWQGGTPIAHVAESYFQEFIPGDAAGAIYVGDGGAAHLLGVTRQLVGESFCHAAPFHYCGSVGPLTIAAGLRSDLEKLGSALTAACHLRGVFGVDGVLRDDGFWPVEVNPRYSASVEVLEYATGLQALSWHRAVFEGQTALPALPASHGDVVGKAFLMARQDVAIPDGGPWESVLESPGPVDDLPAFADIPHPGELIKAGQPILTLFARADVAACQDELRRIAADLDQRLFG